MRRIFTVLLLVIVSGLAMAQTKVDVTLNVNLGVAAFKGKFNVSTDKVILAGTMNNWANPAGTEMARTSSTKDTVYSVKLSLYVDSTYEFKFQAPAGNWESVNNRSIKVKANAADNIYTYYYNDDNVYTLTKAIKITFKCNMELEISKGNFDISKDTLNVRGSFNGWSGTANLMKKALTSNIFSVDTTIMMAPTDTLFYKFAYKNSKGVVWESDPNAKVGASSSEFAAGAVVVPTRYFDNGDKNASENAFDVYFQVDCKNAQAAGGIKFPNGVKTVTLCGSQLPLIWPGAGWPDSDLPNTIKCHDDGLNGDLVKGDNIWSAKVTFPKYSNVTFQYKYSVNYSLATENGGVNDNENSVGENHILTIPKNATVIKTSDIFGTMGNATFTGVKDEHAVATSYSLEQNYPNPFNPSTVIRFSIPENGMTTLKVYDVLGKEVATLINSDLKAGVYEQTFDASHLTSGIYFYTIQSGSFIQSKKMILVK